MRRRPVNGSRQLTGTRVVVEPMGTPVGPIMGPMLLRHTDRGTTEGTMAPATTG